MNLIRCSSYHFALIKARITPSHIRGVYPVRAPFKLLRASSVNLMRCDQGESRRGYFSAGEGRSLPTHQYIGVWVYPVRCPENIGDNGLLRRVFRRVVVSPRISAGLRFVSTFPCVSLRRTPFHASLSSRSLLSVPDALLRCSRPVLTHRALLPVSAEFILCQARIVNLFRDAKCLKRP